MPHAVFDATLDWISATATPSERLELTFHGGEPLLAGIEWYESCLRNLRKRFGERARLHVQSNLWLLNNDFCQLFRDHHVSLGTSLDGPKEINDLQRGHGYFARTMAGIRMGRRHGLDVGVICTFTRLSAPRYREVFDFFLDEHLSPRIHAAVASLGGAPDEHLSMSPGEHAELLVDLFDLYMENVSRIQVSTFDDMARSISSGKGGVCTFTNCLGHHLTVGPQGGIYSCNRFAGHPEWRLGSVLDPPDMATLRRSDAWQRLEDREESVQRDCAGCAHFSYCRGGCSYNAFTGGKDRRDPHCLAYRRVFDRIADRAMEEVFSEPNIEAVVQEGPGRDGFLRRGPLLQIMRDGPHPRKVAARAREVAAAVALAASASPEEALGKLDRAGIITQPESALNSLKGLRQRLDRQAEGLVNAYLHVTYACNLACAHCYASAGLQRAELMAVDDMARLVREVSAAGFRKAVITGGEPLMHAKSQSLLDALATLRGNIGSTQIVLRTNLAYPLSPALVECLLQSAHQVAVSLDGDELTHDTRRGAGTHARTVINLRALVAGRERIPASATLSMAATLTTEQTAGLPGEAARALARELGVSLRIKPVLPLGRGGELGLAPEFYSSHEQDGAEALACSAGPRATCGLGMNLYVDPAGECFPCYALMGPRHALGNALREGLSAVLSRNAAYREATVDRNRLCRACALRYLCGGLCRAWARGDDADAPPRDCAVLHTRARKGLVQALRTLEIPLPRWQEAGLPLPDEAPAADSLEH